MKNKTIKTVKNDTTLTLGTLMGAVQSLDRLAASKLPINISFRISRFLKELSPIVTEGFTKQDELLAQQAKDKNTAKAQKAFLKARDALYAEEIVMSLPKLTIQELTATGIEITPADLLALDWLVTE